MRAQSRIHFCSTDPSYGTQRDVGHRPSSVTTSDGRIWAIKRFHMRKTRSSGSRSDLMDLLQACLQDVAVEVGFGDVDEARH